MEFEKYFKKEILGLSIIETIHNYIDDNMILRKGAIESPKDKLLILPGNMKDGIWLVKGKGNSKWLNSAPHGMGRVMSRTESKKTLSLSEFEKQMDDIQTFNDLVDIIDDAPNSYKNPTEVLDASKDTISIVNQIKPLFNYKEKFKNESED
jgi:RNA-splicing ligase RtcB